MNMITVILVVCIIVLALLSILIVAAVKAGRSQPRESGEPAFMHHTSNNRQ